MITRDLDYSLLTEKLQRYWDKESIFMAGDMNSKEEFILKADLGKLKKSMTSEERDFVEAYFN